ncbi:MAG: glycerol-3-phosphate 1-O-acyltransferase PlsY [Candidatus Marinimicrobia bacterium]|jgi:glycerol-3-phosphate acyltransferase PlsY|nr:glycerol-3-phosphate 1-O-acyltransferase PlsY [Candidatus Neomarinimicrobiota bacterium]MDD5708948.1 glycerol-3-phosphate 1-O-acyltransferase PlsY [Candidatus Neomarinimicrobiota bacterium]MDX9778059.1 glycerol-3-phosphate 1-O-acyltransferase PlsY [bacterium]
MIDLLIIILLSYLIGSFPTGVIAGRLFKKIDIRDYGSGNMGATNAFRVLGSKIGLLVALIDMMKGALVVLFVVKIRIFSEPLLSASGLFIIATLAVVLGHIKPLFARFKGGKGFGTAAGAILTAYPPLAPFCFFVFLLTLVLSGNVAFSDVITAFFLPVLYYLMSRYACLIYDPLIFGFFIASFLLTFIIIRKKFFQYLRGEAELFTGIMLFRKRKENDEKK